jgi:transmembrane sensor
VSRAGAEKQAALWLLRREEHGWGEADQAELDAWLNESAEHKAAFWRLEHGQTKLARMAALGTPANAKAGLAVESRRPLRRWLPFGLALAAAIGVVTLVLPNGGLFGFSTYATDIGGRKEVLLPDGTRVELNTSTRMETSRAQREVWLEQGEAYFDVIHDPSHPFVVHAGPKTVTVLGTKFSVRRQGDRIEVAVVEGRVSIANAGAARRSADAVVITPGDIAVADASSTLVEPKSLENVETVLAWRYGRLKFHETTLTEAAAEFNRYNHTKLVIADSQVAGTRIGGNFEADDVQDFARLLSNAYGFRVQADGDELKVSSPP